MRRGSAGIGFLRPGSNRPFSGQLGLQLLEGNLQRARALGLKVLGLELHVAALVVNRHPPAGDDLQAVLRAEAQQPRLRAPHHHPQLRRAVLQGEVQVPGFGRTVVRDLAFDVDVGESAFHLRAHGRYQLAHRINLALRRLESQPELFACQTSMRSVSSQHAFRCSLFAFRLKLTSTVLRLQMTYGHLSISGAGNVLA